MVVPHSQGPSRAAEQSPSRLTVSVDLTAGRIILVGSLDRRTTRHLLDGVRTLCVVHQAHWILDADGLTDYDVAGLRALGACYRTAVRHGAELTVVGASPRLRTALNRLRLDPHVITSQLRAPEQPRTRGRAQYPEGTHYPLVKVPA